MNNLLLHCDNLLGLKYLLQERNLRSKIDLVYIDPPYARDAGAGHLGIQRPTGTAVSDGEKFGVVRFNYHDIVQ